MNLNRHGETTMESPAATVWLDAWERGMSVAPVRRPAVLLETFHGEEAGPGRWAMGRREAALIELRTTLFGGAMESVAVCPRCSGMLGFTLHAHEILAGAPPEKARPVVVDAAGERAVFRLPDTTDLEAAAHVPAAQRRRFLLARCVAESGGSDDWPEEFLDEAARQMAEADPLGDISLGLSCPDCRQEWNAPFDAGTFLWTELNAWASRLMSEIHVLAATYGWTEPEILALPPHRRRFYLERLQ